MKVHQLIAILNRLDDNAEVKFGDAVFPKEVRRVVEVKQALSTDAQGQYVKPYVLLEE